MQKIISTIITVLITSFYFFPFAFTFLPVANTKMILAGCGLIILITKLASGKKASIDTGFCF